LFDSTGRNPEKARSAAMADDNIQDGDNTPDESQQPDPIKNLKAEMNRKLESFSAQNQQLSGKLDELTRALVARQAADEAARQPAKKPIKDLIYEDPDAAADEIASRVEQRVSTRVNAQLENQNQRQAVLQGLANDYPELTEDGSELQKLAVRIHSSLSESEKASPNAYKLAVREAAAELGIMTQKKRQNQGTGTDDFTLRRPTAKKSSRQDSRSSGDDEDLDPMTVEFAKVMSEFTNLIDADDPKVMDRIKKRAQRDYKRYK
jgi:hypothetical protein